MRVSDDSAGLRRRAAMGLDCTSDYGREDRPSLTELLTGRHSRVKHSLSMLNRTTAGPDRATDQSDPVEPPPRTRV